MDGEVIRLQDCFACGASIDASAKYCSMCGKLAQSDQAASTTLRTAATEFVTGTVQEAKLISKEALRSDLGKKVAAGAAIGAVMASAVPFVGWATGAVLGAGFVAYKRLTK